MSLLTKLEGAFKPIMTRIANDIKSIESRLTAMNDKYDHKYSELSNNQIDIAMTEIPLAVGNNEEKIYLTRVGNFVSVMVKSKNLTECSFTITEKMRKSPKYELQANIPNGFKPESVTPGMIHLVNSTAAGNPSVYIDGNKVIFTRLNSFSTNDEFKFSGIIFNYTTIDDFPAN